MYFFQNIHLLSLDVKSAVSKFGSHIRAQRGAEQPPAEPAARRVAAAGLSMEINPLKSSHAPKHRGELKLFLAVPKILEREFCQSNNQMITLLSSYDSHQTWQPQRISSCLC